MTGIVVPGKLYGAMAAGRPAVFVGPEHCESADTIRDAGCGLTVRPATPTAWSRRSRASPPTRVSLAAWANGDARRSSPHHERKLCCDHWYELIGELVARPEARRQAIGRAGTTARHARWRRRAVCHTVSVSRRERRVVRSTTTRDRPCQVRVNAVRSTTLFIVPW